MYLLLDGDNIVRCMASEACNLHKDKLETGMKKVECSNPGGTVGDRYDPETGEWEAHPENYPQPSEEELYERRINTKIREIAIRELEKEDEQGV